MKNYELVILLQPQLSKDEHEKLVSDIEKLIAEQGGKILATDDMGITVLAHQITKAKLTQAYFISYQLDLSGDKIQALKSTFAITKGIVRFFFFIMDANEKFVSFKDTNKTWEPKEDKKPKEVIIKKGALNDDEMVENINWKSVNFLRHYMTRFGDIKPRAFMGNRVKHQKKIRKAIIRARELGVLPYTR
ncbi:30S ribosomal protein S6 [Patescibacteria group bacterium]|nr:30S ribosomal protein S6 [Patescibacteria group bacterium]